MKNLRSRETPLRNLFEKTNGHDLASQRAMKQLSPERQRTLQLHERVFKFATAVLIRCPTSVPHLASREMWRQLVRAAASASNNLEEADEASSDADFVEKMKIALREAKEARRCLRFVAACRLANHQQVGTLEDEARQIASIFAAIVINTKRRIEREKANRQKRS